MENRSCVGVVTCALLVLSTWAATVRGELPCRDVLEFPNVEFAQDLGRIAAQLQRHSPTFRKQCERIAAARHLRVEVRISTTIPSRCVAFTAIKRSGREVRATVHLPPTSALQQMMAHEFEHLIEQIEGVNLRALSRTPRSGVWAVDRDVYETDRAIAAGKIVEDEQWRAANRRTAD